MATYYVRADGTLDHTQKASAVSADSPSTSLSPTAASSTSLGLSAGDVLFFSAKGGQYTAQITAQYSGTSGNGIVISGLSDGENGAKPVVSYAGSAIKQNAKNYITIENFTVEYTGATDTHSGVSVGAGSGVNISGIDINMNGYGYGIAASGSLTGAVFSDILVTGCGSAREAIYLYGSSNTNISISDISANTGRGVTVKNASGLSLTNLTASLIKTELCENVEGNNLHINGTLGLNILSCSDVDIGDVEYIGTVKPIDINNSSTVVINGLSISGGASNSTVRGSSSEVTINGLEINDSRGITISGTAASVNITSPKIDGCTLTGAILISENAENVTITSPEITNSVGDGMRINGSASGVIIDSGIISGCTGNAIGIYDTANDVTIERCFLFSNGDVSLPNSDGLGIAAHGDAYGINIFRTVAFGNANGGIGGVGQTNGMVVHCCCFDNGHSVAPERGGLYFATTAVNPTTSTGWEVANTLLVNNAPRELFISNPERVTTQYNAGWHPADESFATVDAGTTDITQTAYQATYEPSMVAGNPSLGGEGRIGDFALATHAALVITGVNDTGELDHWGNATPAQPNIGADQGAAKGFGHWTPFNSSMPALTLSPTAPGYLRSVQAWSKVATAQEINKVTKDITK